MGACGKILRSYERRGLQILLHQPPCHRRHSTNHHAHRLAAPSPVSWGFLISFAPPLETGGVLPCPVCRDDVVSLDSTFFSGCHLARYCHRSRTPASGEPGCCTYGFSLLIAISYRSCSFF